MERKPDITGQPPPRAFAQGVGLVLQAVGVTLFLSTCCVCSSAFLWDPILPPDQAMQMIDQPHSLLRHPARTGLMLTVVTMTMGGLALATFGLGLQADRMRAAWGAVITNIAMALLLFAAGAGLWMGDGSWFARTGHGAVLLTTLLLLGFTFAALKQVRAAPPPVDVDIVPPGTKIPYSFYHDDPPEVRLKNELAQRREKLEREKQELDQMEQDLHDKQPPDD